MNITANSLVPVSPHLAALAVAMFFIGVSFGAVDNGEPKHKLYSNTNYEVVLYLLIISVTS